MDWNGFISIGQDVRIAESVKIKRPHLCQIGNHVSIDDYFYCTTGLDLANYIHIGPHISVIGGELTKLVMESYTTISTGSRLICASDEMLGEGLVSTIIPAKYRDRVIVAPITMKKFSNIGANVVVMPGVVIGEGAVVGAGSFVNHDIPDWEIWAGSPAVKIKTRPAEKMKVYAEKLEKNGILE